MTSCAAQSKNLFNYQLQGQYDNDVIIEEERKQRMLAAVGPKQAEKMQKLLTMHDD